MKKSSLFLFVITICLCSISGCSSRQPEGKTVITFQTWNPADYGPDSPIYKIIDSFEKENPYIKINYVFVGFGDYQDHLRVELMGNNGPDVFGIPSGVFFDTSKAFEEELTPYCEEAWGSDSCTGCFFSDRFSIHP